MFNGKNHYKWWIFHSKLLVITRGYQAGYLLGGNGVVKQEPLGFNGTGWWFGGKSMGNL